MRKRGGNPLDDFDNDDEEVMIFVGSSTNCQACPAGQVYDSGTGACESSCPDTYEPTRDGFHKSPSHTAVAGHHQAHQRASRRSQAFFEILPRSQEVSVARVGEPTGQGRDSYCKPGGTFPPSSELGMPLLTGQVIVTPSPQAR